MRTARLIAISLGMIAFIPLAQAQRGMPDTRKMTCPEIQALIARQGAAVLATSDTTYDRYVRDMGFCRRPDVVKPMWVPSLNGACYVGGICWDPGNDSSNR